MVAVDKEAKGIEPLGTSYRVGGQGLPKSPDREEL